MTYSDISKVETLRSALPLRSVFYVNLHGDMKRCEIYDDYDAMIYDATQVFTARRYA